MALNTEQKKAVAMHDGHVCVVAGAGSGKTRVLIERIVSMIKSGVSPKGILAFTFTRKAADEMRERLTKSLGEAMLDEMFVGTIHSLFFRILKENLPRLDMDYSGGMVIAKEWQQKKMLKAIHDKHGFASEGMEERVALGMIGRAKNMCLNVGGLEMWLSENEYSERMITYYTTCYKEYEKAKRKEGLIDFDDMLYISRKIFAAHPDVREKWQAKFTHISVDEYQDINPVQESLIHTLQEKCGNLFVVGDPKQSVYSFRGSDPKFILEFNAKYADCRLITLHKNYRCGKVILDHANKLISCNPEGESMSAELSIEGEVNVLGAFDTGEDEGNAIAEAVLSAHEFGRNWKEMAILYRCNHQSRPIEDALIRQSIPYEIIGSEGFYGRAEIKDVLAYMEVALHGDDLTDPRPAARIVNKPTRYLGKKFSEEWADEMHNYDGALDCLVSHNFRTVNSRSTRNVTDLHNHLCGVRNYLEDPAGAVRYIRHTIGFDKWWLDNKGGDNAEDVESLANLNELSASAENFKSMQSMLNYVAEIQRKYSEKGKGNKVKLMSFHRAKGLEFPVVFMVGMNDAFLPHVKSDNLNEERRLAYVGITRAKEVLHLSYHESVRDRMAGPSLFLPEMGVDLDELEAA